MTVKVFYVRLIPLRDFIILPMGNIIGINQKLRQKLFYYLMMFRETVRFKKDVGIAIVKKVC